MEQAIRPSGAPRDRRLPHSADADILRACQRGDAVAYRELLARYRKSALALAFQMLGNAEDAEDVAQEAFVKVFQSIGGFRGEASFSTWLYRIVTNLCLGRIRSRRPCLALEALGEPGSAEESDEHVTESLLTRQVLSLLSADLRAVLLLREQGSLSYLEIATALHL